MLTQLHIQNFKSWHDTGQMRFAPLTGFFGPNSSGKTSILQFLLMLKQTVESVDRRQVLNLGTERSHVMLNTFEDMVFRHQGSGKITFAIAWKLVLGKSTRSFAPTELPIDQNLNIEFTATIFDNKGFVAIESFTYGSELQKLGMAVAKLDRQGLNSTYNLYIDGHALSDDSGTTLTLPSPIKFYGFPSEVNAYYARSDVLSDLVLNFENQFDNLFYLGPLREYPNRSYTWSGQWPGTLGNRGELAIQAMIASQFVNQKIGSNGNYPTQVEVLVPKWLKALGLIHSFRLETISKHSNEYEVRLRLSPEAPEVLLTDVGFGISQILPVLTLCSFAPEGSTIILEQPDIHLHPAIQAGLADVFIDVIKNRGVQIILESHSEHLLRRLQRRIAEEQLVPTDVALYFTQIENGESKLEQLKVDAYGSINNWPQNFFGDEMGDLVAMTEAAMQRQGVMG